MSCEVNNVSIVQGKKNVNVRPVSAVRPSSVTDIVIGGGEGGEGYYTISDDGVNWDVVYPTC